MKLLRSSPSQKTQSSFSMITGIGPESAETCFFNDKSLCTGHGLPPLAFRICGIWSSGHDAVLYPDYRWIAGRVRRSDAAGTEQCRCQV
jgi:hypothetical protein